MRFMYFALYVLFRMAASSSRCKFVAYLRHAHRVLPSRTYIVWEKRKGDRLVLALSFASDPCNIALNSRYHYGIDCIRTSFPCIPRLLRIHLVRYISNHRMFRGASETCRSTWPFPVRCNTFDEGEQTWRCNFRTAGTVCGRLKMSQVV